MCKKRTEGLTRQEALSRLTALCSQSEHCSHEMVEKMRKWGVDEETQAGVMEYLVRERYVDDARFTRCFALDKIRYDKWGRRKIEQVLWLKRIDKAVMAEVLDSIDEEEYLKVLRPLLKNRKKSVKAASDYECSMKLTRFALGRGFCMKQIRECMDAPVEMDDEDAFDMD